MIEEGITEKEWTERLIRQGCKFTFVTVARAGIFKRVWGPGIDSKE
jgi:hypothetical protein